MAASVIVFCRLPDFNKSLLQHSDAIKLIPVLTKLTRSSVIAEGLRKALVSRNPATTKHLT